MRNFSVITNLLKIFLLFTLLKKYINVIIILIIILGGISMSSAFMWLIILLLSTILYVLVNKGKKLKIIFFTDCITIFALLALFITLWFNLNNVNEPRFVTFWSCTLIVALIINILIKIKISINLIKQAKD